MLENISALSTIRSLSILTRMKILKIFSKSTIRSLSIFTRVMILTILSTNKTRLKEINFETMFQKHFKVEGQDRVKVEVVGKFG